MKDKNGDVVTVSQLIDWLKTLPDQDATVLVCKKVDRGSGYTCYTDCDEVEFSTDQDDFLFDYNDWTQNQFVKEDHPMFGKKTLLLGSC